MELFDISKLGLDATAVVAVVFLTFILKTVDRRNRFKAGYVLFPLISAMLVCLVGFKFEWKKWLMDSLVYAAIAAYVYDMYANMVKPKITRKR